MCVWRVESAEKKSNESAANTDHEEEQHEEEEQQQEVEDSICMEEFHVKMKCDCGEHKVGWIFRELRHLFLFLINVFHNILIIKIQAKYKLAVFHNRFDCFAIFPFFSW